MSGQVAEAVAASVRTEAAEDYVGLWSVVRNLRQRMPDASEGAVQSALEDVIRRLLSSDCVFGQFVDDLGFVAWPPDRLIEQVLDELATLGRDPDIGEVGWFLASTEVPI